MDVFGRYLEYPESEKKDFVAVSFALMLMRTVYIAFMNTISGGIGFDTSFTSYLYYGVVWVLFLVGVIRNNKNSLSSAFKVFIAVLFFLGIVSSLIGQGKYVWDVTLKDFVVFDCRSFLHAAVYLLFVVFLVSLKQLRYYLYSFSRIFMILVLINDFLTVTAGLKIQDDMMYSYGVCVLTCSLLYEFLNGRKILDLALVLIGFISAFISGTRGPIICILSELFLWLILNSKRNKISLLFVTLIFAVIAGGFYDNIIIGLGSALSSFGVVDLRLMDYYEAGILLDSSGRDNLSRIVLQSIAEHPILGLGIGGDRAVIGYYCHNIILEILCEFGIVLGSAFILYLIRLFRKCFISEDEDLASVGLILFSSFVVGLFFSSSYLIVYEFFIVIGLYLNNYNKQKTTLKVISRDERNTYIY